MKKNDVFVFIDVDGTLIDKDDNPRPYLVYLFMKLHRMGCNIVVWSAGGNDYAEQKIGMIERRVNIDISQFVDYFFGKSVMSKMEIDGRRFYIDDHQSLLDSMKKEGHGTFKVPFYEPIAESMKQDCWLLNAGQAAKLFVEA